MAHFFPTTSIIPAGGQGHSNRSLGAISFAGT